MRCMARNKRTIHVRKFTGTIEYTNVTGTYTGEFKDTYADPVEMRGVVSPPTGEVYRDMFGALADYDCILTIDDPDCPIDEDDIVLFSQRGSTEDEYIVKRCAPSLNTCVYALTRVTRT